MMNSPPIWSFPGKQALALASIPAGRVKAAERHHTRPVYRLPARFRCRQAIPQGVEHPVREAAPAEVLRLKSEGKRISDIVRALGISRPSIYRILQTGNPS
jgi:DNA invertase Pin-like site-specific DNA recombinase